MFLILITVIQLFSYCHSAGLRFNEGQGFLSESADAEPIAPYSFGYTADAIGGQSSRHETSDGTGTVRGSYSILGADGQQRTVDYIADAGGFRAQVRTNEFGTESKSPADVRFISQQPSAKEIALKYGQFYKSEGHLSGGSLLKTLPNAIQPTPQAIGQHPFALFETAHKSFIESPIESSVELRERPVSLDLGLNEHRSYGISQISQPQIEYPAINPYESSLRGESKLIRTPIQQIRSNAAISHRLPQLPIDYNSAPIQQVRESY